MNHLTSDNFLTSPLWFDQEDAPQQLQEKLRRKEISETEAKLIAKFREDGYAMLDIDGIDAAIDNLQSGIDRLWKNPPFDLAAAGPGHDRPLPMSEGVKLFGREPGVRLLDIHSHIPGAQELYLNEQLHRLCTVLFDAEAIATQSLYFEYGSTQSLHRDPWYVNHNPRSHLLAAWFALEDIHPDAGPLNYVPGSHKLPYFRFNTDDIVFHDPRVSNEERIAAVADMNRQIAAHDRAPQAALPKRGQVFLWHGNLIHGGSRVVNPAITRRSLVVHFGRADTQKRRGASFFYEGTSRTFFTTAMCGNGAGIRGWGNPLVGITHEKLSPPSTSAAGDVPVSIGSDHAACSICDGTQFGPGPQGRMSRNGKAPACLQCGSLEIQRMNHRVFAALPEGFLNYRHALQIGVNTGLSAHQFARFEIAPVPTASSMPAFAAMDRQYDLVSMNHTFEYVREDRALFAEVARRMTHRAILHISFSGDAQRDVSQHAVEAGGVYHLYGKDVESHFDSVRLGLHHLVIEVRDSCTDTVELVHLFVKDLPDLAMLRQYFTLISDRNIRLR